MSVLQTTFPVNNTTITLTSGGQEIQMNFADFLNLIQSNLNTPNLQEVTNEGNTTTNDIIVNTITPQAGVQFPNELVANVAIGLVPGPADVGIEITIGPKTYSLAGSII